MYQIQMTVLLLVEKNGEDVSRFESRLLQLRPPSFVRMVGELDAGQTDLTRLGRRRGGRRDFSPQRQRRPLPDPPLPPGFEKDRKIGF